LMELADEFFSVAIVRPCLIYRPDAKGNIASLARLMKLMRVIPLGYRHNRRSILEMEHLLSWLERIISEPGTSVSIPHSLAEWSLDMMLKRLARDLRISIFIVPLPRFLAAIVTKLRPKVGNRLFGDLLFGSGRFVKTKRD